VSVFNNGRTIGGEVKGVKQYYEEQQNTRLAEQIIKLSQQKSIYNRWKFTNYDLEFSIAKCIKL